jgi:hypothetical protein
MFGKLRAVHWLAILALLAALWWIGGRTSPRARQRTFRERLMQVDTAALQQFTVVPAPFKGLPPIHFQRGTDGWSMRMGADSSEVEDGSVRSVLDAVHDMRTVRLVGRWTDVADRYDLRDSTADRLVLGPMAAATELWVGSTRAGGELTTAVRLPGDPEVYAIAGDLGAAADRTYGDWLPKSLVVGDPRNWTRVSFRFPNDSSYALERDGAYWRIGDQRTDSVRTWRFLESLARSRGQSAADPRDTLQAIPGYRVEVIDTTRAAPMQVTVYLIPQEQRFIVRTSLNPMVVMPFSPKTEIPRMFRPPGAFL